MPKAVESSLEDRFRLVTAQAAPVRTNLTRQETTKGPDMSAVSASPHQRRVLAQQLPQVVSDERVIRTEPHSCPISEVFTT